MSDRTEVHATEWAIVLSDWKRANADVTVHLRGGASLGPGKVTRLPSGALGSAEIRQPPGNIYDGLRETKWTFDLNDVVAITAVASR